jgi:alkaline phosphatase
MKTNGVKAMVLALLVLGVVFTVVVIQGNDNAEAKTREVKNVIVMVPDGCSQSIQTLARWYKGEPLTLDSMTAGTVSTYMFDSVITDSAAAATAFASGVKTSDGFVGVAPDPDHNGILSIYDKEDFEDDKYMPVATVLEGAKLEGKATGIVATSRITHATPAAYGAHVWSRGLESDIMGHILYNDIDVVMGGGSRYLDSVRMTEIDNRGYEYVNNKTQLMALGDDTEKVFGMFASSHMAADQDRQYIAASQPSIAEMTGRAIDFLSNNNKGFFLMVEGSQVDWAGHANDPFYMMTDFLAFDDAVKVAVDFAKDHKNTQVIVFPDHNTGAMSIGHYYQTEVGEGHGYTETTIEDLIGPLQDMICTYNVLASMLGTIDDAGSADGTYCDNDEFRDIFENWWGVRPTDDEIEEMGIDLSNGIQSREIDGYAISRIFSKYYTYLGWTTHGHTGEDVPLWTYGPGKIYGHFDNTEMAEICSDLMGFDLEKVQGDLFMEVSDDALDDWNIKFEEWEITSDNLEIELKDYDIVMPLDKDILEVYEDDDLVKCYNLEGITVHVYKTSTEKVYVSKEAVKIMEKFD